MSRHDGPGEGEDDPRREGAGGAPDDPLAGLRVPDDPRELEADRTAWVAELVERERARRRDRRRARLAGWAGGATGRTAGGARGAGGEGAVRRSGLGPLLALGALAVVVVALLTSVLGPGAQQRPQAAPLASTGAPPGTVGGLLPDAEVRSLVAGTRRSAQSLRPGVVALVPAACDCPDLVRRLDVLASRAGVRLWLVAQEGEGRAVEQASAAATGARALVQEDVDGALLTALQEAPGAVAATADPLGATVLVVGPDGVVDALVPDAQAEGALEQRLGPALAGLGRG
ncbi:hypothetical protein [Vallicoccus soli]|uniref:Uncharacterized protein n=1 Tax=Vallicoccus soli TaxID=2339232 RepID=A0A3A3ZMC3_9ACTN|nr:hypothetical protein [Vallicoccus soli]RJK97741.1 hypothetical protein D5H78_01710 [Vallicoccus soli]